MIGSMSGQAAAAHASTALMRVIVREKPLALYVAEADNFIVADRR